MITAEQFAEWKTHPVTKEIFDNIREIREEIKEQLASGVTIGGDAESTYGYTMRAVAKIESFDQLLNISFTAEKTDVDVNEQSGY